MDTKPANGDVTSTLIIESLTLDDKADIKAVGKNPAGEVSATAKLNVIGLSAPNSKFTPPDNATPLDSRVESASDGLIIELSTTQL